MHVGESFLEIVELINNRVGRAMTMYHDSGFRSVGISAIRQVPSAEECYNGD